MFAEGSVTGAKSSFVSMDEKRNNYDRSETAQLPNWIKIHTGEYADRVVELSIRRPASEGGGTLMRI